LLCAVKQLLSEVGDRINLEGAGVRAERGQGTLPAKTPAQQPLPSATLSPTTGLLSQSCPYGPFSQA